MLLYHSGAQMKISSDSPDDHAEEGWFLCIIALN